MELWIRSQDKQKLVKIDILYVSDELNDGREILGSNLHYTNRDLGTYATKERALEVLDEIQNILMPIYIINSKSMKLSEPYEENGMVLMDCNANARIEQLSTYVYEMPVE